VALGAILVAAPMAADEDPGATGSQAQRSEPCEGWFPDLTCGRSGRFFGMHKPIVQPYLFEDPFITTGLYPYYVWHEFPDRSALQGGDIQVVAAQVRVALTDRVALIATKDGYAWSRPDNPLLGDSEGWFNIAGGLKVALAGDEESGYLVSGILRVEFPSGAHDVFQGEGDGMALPSVAAAWDLGRVNLIGDFGAQIPFDGDEQSTSLFYHLYADFEAHPRFQPFVQLSGITWVSSGDGSFPIRLRNGVELPLDTVQTVLGTGAFDGADVANLGSRGVSGLDLYTAAVGAHVPITENLVFSVAYERPFSHHKGIFQQRVTTALQLEF
jgi:hypothetical protein